MCIYFGSTTAGTSIFYESISIDVLWSKSSYKCNWTYSILSNSRLVLCAPLSTNNIMVLLIGFVGQLVTTWFAGFWVLYVFHLFLSLVYPFRVKEMMDSKMFRRKAHLIEVTIVVFLGSVIPILTILLSEYLDDGVYCIPQSPEVLFYVGVIPILLVCLVGLTLLLGSFQILRRVSCTFCLYFSDCATMFTVINFLQLQPVLLKLRLAENLSFFLHSRL